MVRQTSVEAFNAVIGSKLLGERLKLAYHVLFEAGPLTGNELSQHMGYPSQWKRCSELKKRGLAIEVGERKCTITGLTCLIWDVTNNLPHKPEKVMVCNSKNQLIKELAASNKRLRDCLQIMVSLMDNRQDANTDSISEHGKEWLEQSRDAIYKSLTIL